jgi:hypothetical protein
MPDLSNEIHTLMEGGIDSVTFEEVTDRRRHPHPPRRRTVARLVSVAVLVAVAVPVVLALSSARPTATITHQGGDRRRVLAALSQTIASGSFDITFSQGPVTAPTSPTTTTTTCASTPGDNGTGNVSSSPTGQGWQTCFSAPGNLGLDLSGTGTVDTSPFAMVAVSQVPGFGQISLHDNGTDVWETGGGNYGQSPDTTGSSPGSPLSGFAGSVEGTLGPRQGALDMMGLASPTGYLELDESSITSADQIGSGSVDGVPVTIYQVTLYPAQEATVAGSNPQEASAIQAALDVLKGQGYTQTTVKISIDGSGYIRQTVSVAAFSDGATATNETTFSNFGCAGTVLMPGQQESSSPPTGCVSPDTSPSGPPS